MAVIPAEFDDEVFAGLNRCTHHHFEGFLGFLGVVYRNPTQYPRFGVKGCFKELVVIHLAEAFEPSYSIASPLLIQFRAPAE